MTNETRLILQETFETCSIAMDNFIGLASKLEAVGQLGDAIDLRDLAGQIESYILELRRKHC